MLGEDKYQDTVSIILSYANTENKKKQLKQCISKLKTQVILSSHYPIDDDIQKECDWVIHDSDNPLLYNNEFQQYGLSYGHWVEGVYKEFEVEHSYCVYTLIKNGLLFAKALGKTKAHIINYDYDIEEYIIEENNIDLNTHDAVFYSHFFVGKNSYIAGFFSGNIDVLLQYFGKIKDKKEFYFKESPLFEHKIYDNFQKLNLNIKEKDFFDLEKKCNINKFSILDSDNVLEVSNPDNLNNILKTQGINKNFSKMVDEKIRVELHDDLVVSIHNTTPDPLLNCSIEVKNIFYINVLLRRLDLQPYETYFFKIGDNFSFVDHWITEKLFVKVFHNHELVCNKHLNDKTKCFILLSNQAFEKLTEQTIIGLNRYTNVDIIHYTVNYKSDLKYPNLTNIEFPVEGDTTDPQFMQFIKPSIFLDILERGYKNVVFLDSDIQVRSNINDIFSYVKEIEDGPIFHKSQWDFVAVNGTYVPGPLLTEALDLKGQNSPHGITNIVLFNQSHKELFRIWKEVCFSEKINSIRKLEFMHDELILNCLMWKNNIKPKLFYFSLNVVDRDDVEFFYEIDNKDYIDSLNMNDFNKGHHAQSYIPYDKSQVLVFHCIKNVEEAKKVNELIYQKEVIMPNLENLTGFDWISLYTNIKKNDNIIKEILPTFNINFIDGPFVEIKHSSYKDHKVSFINKNDNFIEYSSNIGNNCWVKTNKKYFVDWKITVEDENGNLIHDYDLNFENEKVYIALDSKSLGDTLAWFPYIEEFRKKHKCKIICSTFHNSMFKPYYPQFEFIKPGEVAYGIKAMYTIGWFYEGDNGENINHFKNPHDFKSQFMQKTASDILGLEFEEVKPIITNKKPLKKKQIAIAIHSTTQAKYWNNPTGWQEVVDWCKDKGYEVKLLSREGDGYMGNNHPKGIKIHPEGPLDLVMDELLQSEAFIGIGSGLSWLSWALNVPTVLISGFSKDYTEPASCYRITAPEGKCNGCFNTHRLDAGDWNWCPVHKGTDRQFECSKSITSEMVIEKLKEILVVS